MPHNTEVVDEDDAFDGEGPEAQQQNAAKHVETRPFPYGIKDSVIPPPPESQISEASDLPLGAHPGDPSMPPRAEPQARPPRPGRSPLADPALPEALLDSPTQTADVGARAKSPAHLPQGLQEDFDAMSAEVEEETAERPVAHAVAASLADSFLDEEHGETVDSFEEARTEVSGPSEHVQAAEKRDGMEVFSEESSTVVTPEAPSYPLPPAGARRGRLVIVALALLLLAGAGVAAYRYFSGSRDAVPDNGAVERSRGGQAFEGNTPLKRGLPEIPPVVPALPDAETQLALDADVQDASTPSDANISRDAALDSATTGSSDMGASVAEDGVAVDLPEVPESIERLPERRRTREARKQLRLGNRLLRRKRVDSALWHYERALTFDPKFAAAARGKLRVLLMMERNEAALAWAKYSIELESDSTHAWVALAEAYEALDRKPDAIAAYEKALELAPRNRSAKHALAKLRR